jgi:coenzyme F420-reducing hydrogenase beta subunit
MKIICPEEQCTGCAACFNICPVNCIQMVSDAEGFLRPEIADDECTDCGACKRVCPMLNLREPDHSATPEVYALWNKDESVRFQSASGGAFSAFAEYVLDSGGVVFGAAFDDLMQVRHIGIHQKNELEKLRSSKYVQSNIGDSYREVKKYLRMGKTVLFSGTPCQVAALTAYLGRDYQNLYKCDILCHGVPSPGLFANYLKFIEKKFQCKLSNINVRHKLKGWGLNSTVALFRDGKERVLTNYNNSFMFGFINCFSLRPSCYLCPYTNVDRYGDITMGDFWGIGEYKPFKQRTRNGISLILVNSNYGRQLFEKSFDRFCCEKRTLEEAKYKRTKLSHPLPQPRKREQFFDDYKKLTYEELAKKHLVEKGMKGLIKKVVPREYFFYFRKFCNKIQMLSRK